MTKVLDPGRPEQYNSAMSRFTVFLTSLLSIATLAFGQSETKRYLYLSMPDGAQKEGRSDPPGILIFDIDNGHKLVRRIEVPIFAEGLRGFAGNLKTHRVYFSATDRMIRQIKDVGERGIFPYTMDSRNRIGYVCLGDHVGFDVVNLQTGKVLHRVLAGDAPIAHRTHGSALTPDETELWISDQVGRKLFIFDATKMPPTPKGQVELSQGGHGWVCFSLDGRYAWSHAPEVFDARTKKLVATLKDEKGNPVSGSKYIEVHFRDGKVVQIGNEFGLGRKAHLFSSSTLQ